MSAIDGGRGAGVKLATLRWSLPVFPLLGVALGLSSH